MTDGGPLRFTDQIPILRAGANFRALVPSYANDAYIVVKTTNDPVANGLALIQAYQDASALNPGGQPISENNRAVVILPPGRYEFVFSVIDDEWQTLGMSNNYVDLAGLTGNPKHVLITSAVDTTNSGTLAVIANFADISGITVQNIASTRNLGDSSDACALFTWISQQGIIYTDCIFNDSGGNSWAMRQGMNCDSTFIRCVSADWSFGGNADGGTAGIFSGVAKGCTAGGFSFAGPTGSITGAIDDCEAGANSFGGDITGATIRNCRGQNDCFGGLVGTIGSESVLINCTATSNSFALNIEEECYLINCIAGSNSFCKFGTLGGILINCKGGFNCFAASGGTVSADAQLRGCIAGNNSFANEGVFAGLAIDCRGISDAFGGNAAGTFSGTAINCSGSAGSFASRGGIFSGRLINPASVFLETFNPAAFTGRISGALFLTEQTNSDGVTIPDGATGEFEFCAFRKNGTGTPLGLASGAATIKFSYCKFNTVAGIAAGITNALGATLAAAFNIGDADV